MITKDDLMFRDEIVYRLLPRLVTRFPIDSPAEALNKAYRLADAFIKRIKQEHLEYHNTQEPEEKWSKWSETVW